MFKKDLRRFLTSDNLYASKLVSLAKRAYLASCNLNYDPATNGELALIKRLADLKCVFDVGANDGSWACKVHEASSASTVFSFEMSSTTFKLLQETAKANDWLRIYNTALSDKSGEIKYFDFDPSSGQGSIDIGPAETLALNDLVSTRIAESTTLDLFCLDNHITMIDFLKIDVEGHEYRVVCGCKSMLDAHLIRVVQIERAGADRFSSLYEWYNLFNSCGYVFAKLLPDRIQVRRYMIDQECEPGSNWVAFLPGTFGDHCSNLQSPICIPLPL